jgi:hypothetical protein
MKNLVLLSIIFLFISGCSKGVDPELNQIVSSQATGCLKKAQDSSFSYIFDNILSVDFQISANCCPDSNRFIFEHNILSDTIRLYVTDIEETLCHCTCNYGLNTMFTELPLDRYQLIIYARYKESDYQVMYSEKVYRRL